MIYHAAQSAKCSSFGVNFPREESPDAVPYPNLIAYSQWQHMTVAQIKEETKARRAEFERLLMERMASEENNKLLLLEAQKLKKAIELMKRFGMIRRVSHLESGRMQSGRWILSNRNLCLFWP
jgi:hypothetical protein